MTEFATKEELQAVIDDLNDRLRKQHAINRTIAMTLNEMLMNSAATNLILKKIVPLAAFPEDQKADHEDVSRIARDFLKDAPKRQEQLCLLLIEAITGSQDGIEEKLRDAFRREP
ncbi:MULTISPECIES: hypothetical protein [Pseudomonas]|uniref:hypothetical protein n=1 Tax=Pseudomonas TaxID=286 RepID=UPI00034F1520|nr:MULTISPECIES: hypothetical protein [Pseudomonas]AGN82858.1 hypothetical protein L483_20495 [Pseudomonas putida H8234]MDH2187177.1 hypothetical protein [Pseudomonas sp. GD03651]